MADKRPMEDIFKRLGVNPEVRQIGREPKKPDIRIDAKSKDEDLPIPRRCSPGSLVPLTKFNLKAHGVKKEGDDDSKMVEQSKLNPEEDNNLEKPLEIRVSPNTPRASKPSNIKAKVGSRSKKNAFILFCDSRRDALIAEGHTFANGYASMAAVLDNEWINLPDGEKEVFKQRAQKMKDRDGPTCKMVPYCQAKYLPVCTGPPAFRPK